MFYAIFLLTFFSIVMLIIDYHSRYNWLFVLMSVGMLVAFFSISMHLTVFGNYYYKSLKLFSLDYTIFSYVSRSVKIPLSTMARMMNAGIAFYLLAVPLFVYEFTRGSSKYENFKKHLTAKFISLLGLVLFNLLFYDPVVAYRLYVWYKLQAHSEFLTAAVNVLYQFNRFLVLIFLFYPVYILYKYVILNTIRYIKTQILFLAVCLCVMDLLFYNVFYMGPFMMSPVKVFTSGFWIFENITLVSYRYYMFIPLITMCVLLLILLLLVNCRMGSLVHMFVDRKIERNIARMNEALGDTLHSQKNMLFSIKLLLNDISGTDNNPKQNDALRKIEELVENSLINTSEMLDSIRDINYKFVSTNLIDAVDDAINKIIPPLHIQLHWDKARYNAAFESLFCNFDRYHITRALVNVLNNAVEAIELAGRGKGIIQILLAQQFQWFFIVIQDNGIGIKKKTIRKMFHPYYSEKKNAYNWGLGLSYTYNVVKAHWGYLRVESKLNQGTEIQIMLPCSNKSKGGGKCGKSGF